MKEVPECASQDVTYQAYENICIIIIIIMLMMMIIIILILICKELGIKLDNEHRYDHVPKSVETSHEGKVTTLWNQQVRTDRTIPNNKPDTMIRDNKKGTCMLLDVARLGDRNVIKKEAEKILKYKDLVIEIQRMWNVKAKVMPVITDAPRPLSKSLRQYLRNIPGEHEIREVQNTAM